MNGLDEYRRKLANGEIKTSDRLSPLEKARNHPTSMRFAVNAKCFDCNGGENHINRTRYCTIFDCGLWLVRPYKKGISREDCLTYTETQG